MLVANPTQRLALPAIRLSGAKQRTWALIVVPSFDGTLLSARKALPGQSHPHDNPLRVG
jgi:hypothetical protein